MTSEESSYSAFLRKKSDIGANAGFAPVFDAPFLYDFQRHLLEWAVIKGRAAIFADCGLGKTPIQLAWAENVVRKTNGRVLILTPLAVGAQTVREGEKFGVEAHQCRDGKMNGTRIVVTNYERLHYFNPSDFAGVVCDESSILKNYSGATRNAIIAFLRPVKYRLLCTATPSPNDYTELGNSVEALGIMRRVEMLSMFFIHDSGDTGKWRVKGHAKDMFWRFAASWARACRKPSDLGFDDGAFHLPPMRIRQATIESKTREGFLFPMTAVTLNEQRQERRDTIESRCSAVAEIANNEDSHFVAWCTLNAESQSLTRLIKGAVELTGSQTIDEKEHIADQFSSGSIRALVTKPGICGHGMNWQHCHRMSAFPSHSHEEFYQMVRRCWRFGQKNIVTCDMVTTSAESSVVENMKRKERQSAGLFDAIVANMANYYSYTKESYTPTKEIRIPLWLQNA
jgi:superfamily II DNA or RNA helicase